MKQVFKMNKIFFALVAFAVLCSPLVFAAQVDVYFPKSQVVSDNGVVDLGIVGPGQTLKIGIRSNTNEFHKTTGKEFLWSQLKILQNSLPIGWSSEDSLLFASEKIASVIVSKDAKDGTYTFDLKVVQDAGQIEPLTFKAKIRVTKEVFDLILLNEPVKAEAGENAVYFFKLKNKSSASEAFKIVAKGLPSGIATEYDSPLIAPFSEQTIEYSLNPKEQGNYKFTIFATALSSDKLIKQQEFLLFVGSSIFGDLKATTRGAMIFPSIEQAIYSLFGLLSLLF